VECVFGYVTSSVGKLSRGLQLKSLDDLYVGGFGASLELRNISPYLLSDNVVEKILDPEKINLLGNIHLLY
jgi:hypothetical protein